MGTVTYRDGVAILQLILFFPISIAGIYLWKLSGWRAGGKIWRYVVIVSLLRVAGGICTMLAININSSHIIIAEAVCEMIGIAPLALVYMGLLGAIDVEKRLPPMPLHLITLACLIGLILAIIGVTNADLQDYHPGSLVKAAMGIFLAVTVVILLLSAWLFHQLSFSMRRYQKKLFIAIALSAPFFLVRLIYSAIGDYSSLKAFAIRGNVTVYLCMSVLEEIISIAITMAFGYSALLEKDFPQPTSVAQGGLGQKHNEV
ncbi:hypothetical protein BDW59DRAFT_158270 [Aspergillus cavernicola]|uniref:DUF7702 domain-containing protein n=1 Tax=Aspergillus cavernicola TaxID=176166 RepID=A0ABR4ISU7_9EURO